MIQRPSTACSASLLALSLFVVSPASGQRAERFMAALSSATDMTVKKDLVYRSGGPGAAPSFDLYRPAKAAAPVPVVVFVNGIGAPWMRGH
ncbi:hypothetical protein OVW19_27420, partial [Klebsiella pneumoniae]|uniref:hypothetical protein n=1 Tax=Klebsiella pneumoniae TaxID=573 RepID=UPI00226FC769